VDKMISSPSSKTSNSVSSFGGAEIHKPFLGDVALKTEVSYVRLHSYLSKIKAPLHAFDDILVLLKREATNNGFDIMDQHPKRKSLLLSLMKQYGRGLEPHRQIVALETKHPRNENYIRDSTNDTCGVYSFDATAAIKSLLDEAGLFTSFSNLAVNATDPFGRFPKGSPLDESISGSWYQDAFDNMVKIFGEQLQTKEGVPVLLFPLCIYLDKTGISILQRHGLEPVMVSCLLLNMKARNQTDRSWRHLGFIPDLDQKSRASKARERSTAAGKGRSCRNYHSCLQVVLASLIEMQQANGFDHAVTLGNVTCYVHLYCPVAFIMGDTKSQDSLCCRVAHYNQPRTCYACYVPFEELSSADHKCSFVTQAEQRTLLTGCMEEGQETNEELLANLKAVSTIRCFSEAMFGLDYGGTIDGQFGACTLDMMHAFKSGVLKDVAKCFIDPMPPRQKESLDKYVDQLYSKQRCSGMNNGLRTNFSKGITNATILTANEWPGLLLTYLVVAQTYEGQDILDKRFDEDDKKFFIQQKNKKAAKKAKAKEKRPFKKAIYSDESDGCDSQGDPISETTLLTGPRCTSQAFVQLVEQLLSFHASYTYGAAYFNQGDERGKQVLDNAMKTMLQQLTTTLVREANGWNLAKVHSCFRHFAHMVSRFGRATNTDAELGERGLKNWAKDHGRHTNKGSTDKFTKQTNNRVYENAVFRKAGNKPCDFQDDSESLASMPTIEQGLVGSPKYVVSYVNNFKDHEGTTFSGVLCKWKTKGIGGVELPSAILEAYTNLYYDFTVPDFASKNKAGDSPLTTRMNTRVEGYTEYVSETGVRYRVHPNYQNNGPWYDWAIIPCPNGYDDLVCNPDPNAPPSVPRVGEGPPFASPNPVADAKQKAGSKRKMSALVPQKSYCETKYGQHHLPAKVVALFTCPETATEKALVHACRPWMQKNYDRTSTLTESWCLQYFVEDVDVPPKHGAKKPGTKQVLKPVYNVIDASDLKENIFVLDENPGLHEHVEYTSTSGHVVFITNRKTHWPSLFL